MSSPPPEAALAAVAVLGEATTRLREGSAAARRRESTLRRTSWPASREQTWATSTSPGLGTRCNLDDGFDLLTHSGTPMTAPLRLERALRTPRPA